ncbi:MAG: hypothetical protein JXB60_03575 [Candidatus Cloacimonetes bacterium]|nr:hypothetical protein [Candidatus Cloacimonadota bacterium]
MVYQNRGLEDWLKLDNAAKIYPAASPKRSPALFRIYAIMQEPVKLWIFKQALQRIMQRCPYYQVELKRGFFWFYLQRHSKIPEINLLEDIVLNKSIANPQNADLLQVNIKSSTIALDFSHIITDGSGGFRFLISLLAEYLRLSGVDIRHTEILLDPDSRPDPEEYEDPHLKSFQKHSLSPQKMTPAFHLYGHPHRTEKPRLITGQLPIEKVLRLTRNKGISITEYLVSLYIYCLVQIYHETIRWKKSRRSVIRLEVPVNMRKFSFPRVMRNFSLFISPEINLKLGRYSLPEIISIVHHSMQMQINDKELNRQISRNVGAELNPLIRFLPLFCKNLYLSGLYSKLGENPYSGVLSNLGRIELPPEMVEYIKLFNVIVYPNHVMKKSCSVISYQQEMLITFASIIESRELERLFFTQLVADGIPVFIREV